MVRMLKVMSIFLFAFTVIGCSNANNKAQRGVIDQYFEFLKEGKIEELEELMVNSEDDEFGAIEFMNNIEELITVSEMFGEVFQEKYKELLIEMRKNAIEKYKIEEIKIEEGEASVTVSGKYAKLQHYNVNDMLDSSEIYDILMEIIEEMGDDVDFEEYMKELNKVIDEKAEDIFEEWHETLKELESKEFEATFTLEEKEGAWIISNVSSEQSLK